MSQRILVPTDGSETAELGLRYAVALAKRLGGTISALYVVDIKLLEGPFLRDLSASLGTAPFVNYQNNIAQLLEERGNAALKVVQDLAASEEVPCDIALVTGVVHRSIVEASELADLVVIGRAGEHSAWLDGLVGSTTEAVARRAKAPVLVTGVAEPGAGPLLLGYDGSPNARQALKTAATVAEDWGVPLSVLCVGGSEADATEAEAKAYFDDRELNPTFLRKSGDPGEAIISISKDLGASGIVIGAYGHSKVVELVAGSTTAFTLNHAACPVLLCR